MARRIFSEMLPLAVWMFSMWQYLLKKLSILAFHESSPVICLRQP